MEPPMMTSSGSELGVELLPPRRRGGRAAPAAAPSPAEAPAAAAPAAAGEPDDDEQPDDARIPDLEESDDSDCELAEEHDDGEETGDTADWKENDHRQFCARDRESTNDFGTFSGWYCVTCCPNGDANNAFCNPSTGRRCYAMHCAGVPRVHGLRLGIKKNRPVRSSPRRASGGGASGASGGRGGRGGRGRGARRSL